MNYFTLTREGSKLHLDAYQGANHIGRMRVRSGLPHKQQDHNFRTVPNERRGEYEPCPEGEFDLGSLEWHGGEGNYDSLWPDIWSPIWVVIYRARAIGFHLDAGHPGTAGCVGFLDMDDLRTFVAWWKNYGPFEKLYVDWGHGYVQMPKLEQPKPEPSVVHVACESLRVTAEIINGRTMFTVDNMRDLGLIGPSQDGDWQDDGKTKHLKLRKA